MIHRFRSRVWRLVALAAVLAAMASFLYVRHQATRQQSIPPGATEVMAPSGASSATSAAGQSAQNTLASFVMKRDRTQSKAIANLKATLSDSSTPSSARATVAAKLAGMTQSVAEEKEIEDLLGVKGVQQAAALVTPTKVVVVVAQKTLSQTEVAMIADVAKSVTGLGYSHISVVPAS